MAAPTSPTPPCAAATSGSVGGPVSQLPTAPLVQGVVLPSRQGRGQQSGWCERQPSGRQPCGPYIPCSLRRHSSRPPNGGWSSERGCGTQVPRRADGVMPNGPRRAHRPTCQQVRLRLQPSSLLNPTVRQPRQRERPCYAPPRRFTSSGQRGSRTISTIGAPTGGRWRQALVHEAPRGMEAIAAEGEAPPPLRTAPPTDCPTGAANPTRCLRRADRYPTGWSEQMGAAQGGYRYPRPHIRRGIGAQPRCERRHCTSLS